MATFASAALQRRKKQAVYGKAVRKTYSVNHDFLQDDEPVVAQPAKSTKLPNVVVSRSVQASETRSDTTFETSARSATPPRKKGALPKVIKSPAKEADPFDIPSSDDDGLHTIGYTSTPLKLQSKSQLVEEPIQTVVLAPWERKAAYTTRTASGNTTSTDSGPEKQLVRKLGGIAGPNTAKIKPSNTNRDTAGVRQQSQSRNVETSSTEVGIAATGSALERLAARRPTANSGSRSTGNSASQSGVAPAKRSTPEPSDQRLPAGKRRRVIATEKLTNSASECSDLTITYQPRHKRPQEDSLAREADIFDVPIESNETVSLKPVMRISPKLDGKHRSRHPARTSRMSSPNASISAPEGLAEMLPPDEDVHVPSVRSLAEIRSRLSTPRLASRKAPARSSSTPRTQRSITPQTTGALTPHQTQMWADFFDPAGKPDPPTPVTSLEKLSIGQGKNVAAKDSQSTKVVTKVKENTARRRTRAVDRLRALAISSSEEDSSEDEDEDMADVKTLNTAPTSQSLNRQLSDNRPSPNSQTSQSQDKAQTATEGGPRITYAKARSHLAEESLDSMILELPMDTPQRPAATARRIGRPAAVPTKSALDLEDSDDDAPAKGVRNIHDLRAAGRNTRIVGEVSDLLQEVADRSTAARSRRRSALIELATKLLDKAFTEQFLGLGFEYQLIAECGAPQDPVADFVLSAMYTLLLTTELSAHTTRAFEPVLPWLAKSFLVSTDITKLAKERRSNMSKAAQGDVMAFAQKIKSSSQLWNDCIPLALSPRLMALKATDSLVGKLRGLGDASELLDSNALALLVPQEGLFNGVERDSDVALQASLVVSILEALSTLSAVGSWPAHLVQAVASLPGVFAQTWQAPSHTKWLAYRLCLNLTNDPAIDQNLFTDNLAVRYLLSDIVSGFENLHQSAPPSDDQAAQDSNALHLDLLVLAIGILTNLAEHNSSARAQATADPNSLPALQSIIGTFRAGQERLLDAASEEESAANVAFGYLAVMLANICQDAEARAVVTGLLPGGRLDVLVEAVEEFVRHHRKVDEAGFEGAEGREVWGRFTERLVSVLERLKESC